MKKLEGKRLLLLGGSLWKESIKDFADKNEIVLIATGNNKDADIFEIADECYNVDSTDSKKMKELIISKNIDGVYLGGSEPVIAAASGYLNELNMPCYCTKDQWETLQNKGSFKNLCIEHDLPVVKQYKISLADILNKSEIVDFPVITKPEDGSGSSGFSICNDFEELETGYIKAADSSPTGSVIVEKFVKNDSVVVFYTFSDGEMYFSGIEDKYPVKYKEQGSYVLGLLIFESNKKAEFQAKFEKKIREMYKSINLKEGSIWMEVFYDGENYYFNEVGYRYGGSVSIYPVDYLYQINQVATDIHYALTGKSIIKGLGSIFKESAPRKKYYAIYSIHLNPGIIKEIDGIEDISKIKNVIATPTLRKVDDIVKSTGTVAQIFAFVHFVFDSRDECIETIEELHRTITIKDLDGNNMVTQLLDTSSISI